jgi:membrane-bound lytic murein transglycosylase A
MPPRPHASPRRRTALEGVSLVVLLTLLSGCVKPTPVVPQYDRPLGPNQPALRRIVDTAKLPNLERPFNDRSAELLAAVNRSLAWFGHPSTQQFFPMQGFTHEHVRLSVLAFRQILAVSTSSADFRDRMLAEFDVYQSVGWNGEGQVLFTGYYSPIFAASRQATPTFRYPLYMRPHDLVSDPATGAVLGRRVNGQLTTYPPRAQIERTGMLAGHELVWLRSKLDAYLVHVQGSAKLVLTDGAVLHVGFAGTNGHEYVSLANELVKDGKLDRHRRGLAAIRAYFQRHPEQLDEYLTRNPRFVFFQEYAAESWPAGSLGFQVTPGRTLATDKAIFPRAAVVLVNTSAAAPGGGTRRFDQFMLDQDTGGAIRAPGRGDIYFGIGPEAEALAGAQIAEGQLYYFLLKPERLGMWRRIAEQLPR